MRLAEISDSRLLLDWRNHHIVRKFSGNSKLISENTHEEWLRTQLHRKQSDTVIFIFSLLSFNVGMSRLERINFNSALVSILVSPDFHNNGIGSKILDRTIQHAFTEMKCSDLLASIHIDNFTSTKLFEKLGFKRIGQVGLFNMYMLLKNC